MIAQLENPSKLPPTESDDDGFYKGNKVYTVAIPKIINLHGYENTNHSKTHNIIEVKNLIK